MMGGFSLFAQLGGRGADPLRSPEVIWGTAGLALALLAGAVVVFLTDRWRKANASRVSDSTMELTEFRNMFERGELTEEEYARLRDKVAKRVKTMPKIATAGGADPANQLGAGMNAPNSLPGPDQPTPPPDSGKPSNPSSPA